MAKSFYDLLLVEHNATFDEIKLAFKRRALQVHPDKGGSKEEFHLVYQALETLSDPVTRKKHDESLSKGYKQGSASKVQKPARRHRQTSSCQAKGDRKPGRAGKKSQGSGKTGPVAQSKQTKLLIKIHDLLKQLPRNTRNDVITKQFSQKQRVLLEKWMVDHLEPSTSEAQALPIASSVPTASTLSLYSPTLKGKDMKHIMDGPCEDKTSLALAPSKKGFGKMRKGCKSKVRSCGFVQKYKGCRSYVAGISFDSMVIRTGSCDLHTALEYLVILTSVKHKMRNHQGMGGTYLQRLEGSLVSSATDHGRNLADLKLCFVVSQQAGCFIGSRLWSPVARNLVVFGKMRSVFEPFLQYVKNVGPQSVYWRYSPVHLEDAWERFQGAVAEAWAMAGVDSTGILQKIRSRCEARVPFRRTSLQQWEQQHMAMQDKNRHRPKCLRERNPTGRLECWERRQMALEDLNKRPRSMRLKLPRQFHSESRQVSKKEAKMMDLEHQKSSSPERRRVGSREENGFGRKWNRISRWMTFSEKNDVRNPGSRGEQEESWGMFILRFLRCRYGLVWVARFLMVGCHMPGMFKTTTALWNRPMPPTVLAISSNPWLGPKICHKGWLDLT